MTPMLQHSADSGIIFNRDSGDESANVFTRQEGNDAEQPPERDFKPWRIFVNHIDSYHGKKLPGSLTELDYVNPQSGGRNAKVDREGAEDEEPEEDELEAEDEVKGETHEAEEESKKRDATPNDTDSARKYEVIGTVLDCKYICPKDVKMIIRDSSDRDLLLFELMKCGIIIYDITHDTSQIDEARWALEAIVGHLESEAKEAPKAFKSFNEVRHFVLISTIMTWALTKPLDPLDPDLPLTEADYRKRKAHPNFKEHIKLEREVVAVRKLNDLQGKLKTLVICCGLTYGDGESQLHHLFKMAWYNSPFLPIIGDGNNRIPLLHVRDFASIIAAILKNWPRLRYILAVELGVLPQKTIVKAISKELSNGRVRNVTPEEAFLFPEITQNVYDPMTLNLNVDPVHVIDAINWHVELPLNENIATIVKQYKTTRGLRPVKIMVLGPPASGKTLIARYLADHYRIHYIHVKSLINDALQKLSSEIEVLEKAETAAGREDAEEEEREKEEEDEEDDEALNIEELQEELNEIRENLSRNKGRLDDVILTKLFQKRLRSKDCSNQGYVIDGFPKTLEQAKGLFENDAANLEEKIEDEQRREDDEEFEEDANAPMKDEAETFEEAMESSIIPELVVSLEASDDFLKERIIKRPEREIQHTHYTEKHMKRRLREYRERNTDDNTPLGFFDEIELHPLILPIENDLCPDMFPTICQILQKIGKPRNYGLTPEEAKEAEERREAEKASAEAAKRLQEARELEERKRERVEKMLEWTSLMEKLKEDEEERLCIQSKPLRDYLARYVFPTLTQGLIEVARLRPDDPVDFLAEYLFKENPEGRMFEPDYTEKISMILDDIEKLQSEVLSKEELDQDTAKFLKDEHVEMEEHEVDTYDSGDVCMDFKSASTGRLSFSYEGEEKASTGTSDFCY